MQEMNEREPTPFRKEWLEENLEELYEQAPCGYLSTLPDGTIFKMNTTLCNWLGYAKDELVGQWKFQQLLAIGGRIFYETHHLPLLAMQGFVKELNYEMVTKSGERKPVLVSAMQKRDAHGKALFHRITVFEFGERKRYEEELLAQKKKAEAATEAKEMFLSTVTHEIRTPIHVLLGVSDLLQKSDPRPDQAALLAAMRFSAENLLHLVNDLLDLSKLNAGQDMLEEKPFDLHLLAQNLTTSLHAIASGKGLKLYLSIAEGLPAYYIGDALKIGRVITNLLGNAIKFTEKGEICLHIAGVQQGEQGKATLAFSISDTGIGIATNKLEAIFQAYMQASGTAGGTGLGLTISQRLLSMYGSKLEVESESGRGSTFRFTLTLAITNEQPVLEQDEQPLLSGIRLLLVEDNASNILIATRYFKLWGLDFDTAPNGQLAVEMVSENYYDLVLMDLSMPVMDGYEATRHIRQLPNGKGERLPILALTASPKEMVAKQLEEAGIDGLVSKPFQSSELYGAIKMAPKTHAPTPAETRVAPEALLDMREIREMFADSNEALLEYFEALLEDLEVVYQDFVEAATHRNFQGFRNAVHKVTSFVRLFRPTDFTDAMQGARELYKNEHWENLPAANQRILEELDRIVHFLQETMNNMRG